MPILNFIISACSFLLLLFSLHLFYAKQGNRLLNRILSIAFFARFGQIIIYLLINSGDISALPLAHKFFTPFYYAAPACFYLYINGFINDRTRLRKYEWLHFTPALLAIIHVSFTSDVNWNEVARQIAQHKQLYITEKTGFFPPYFYYIGRPVLLIGYLAAAWYAVLTSPITKQKVWDINKTWIYFCVSTATFFQLAGILPLIFNRSEGTITSYPWFVALNCIMLVCVIVYVLHQPKLLYGYLFVASNIENNALPVKEPGRTETTSPKNNIPADQLSVYTDAMTAYMETEKPFLLPDFQIVHLAQKLNIPVHHCSFVINSVIGKNFRDYINAYRVNDFMIAYRSKGDRMTIEAIAYECGFKSLATFYNAFKKETGLMPTAYFSQQAEKLLQ